MDWWQRWKAKHWIPEYDPGGQYGALFVPPSEKAPPLRRAARWAKKLWQEYPLGCLSTIAAIVAAFATVIQALR